MNILKYFMIYFFIFNNKIPDGNVITLLGNSSFDIIETFLPVLATLTLSSESFFKNKKNKYY